MSSVIQVKNLSKSYQITHLKRGTHVTLRDSLSHAAKNLGKKFLHPFKKLSISQNTLEEFWALKGISFEVNQGDRIGIIGKNGAGKSTLLKILSRITEPTSGKVKIRGRVSSLLEVGTGFHPELTGKENIFLNGALLGMSRQEIKKKFDAIVAFADIEKFLDTPVKHFSSGMYTRLAFGIAAHVDPDVLIADEVLAVGDAQFQEKCLSKMKGMVSEGRTILFVSHHLNSIVALCNKGIVLDKGTLQFSGPIDQCVNYYVNSHHIDSSKAFSWEGDEGDEHVRFYRMLIISSDVGKKSREFFYRGEEVSVEIEYEVLKYSPNLLFGVRVRNAHHQTIARAHICDDLDNYSSLIEKGRHKVVLKWNTSLFHEGNYQIDLDCVLHNIKAVISDQIQIKLPVYSKQKLTQFEHESLRDTVSLGNQWNRSL